MITGKLTSKAQTTIPVPVRRALDLKPGDSIGYIIEAGSVRLKKITADAMDDPFIAFTEWADDLDKAYDRL